MKKILRGLSLVLVFPFIGILAGVQCAGAPSFSEGYSVSGTIYGLGGNLILVDDSSLGGELEVYSPPTGQTLTSPITYSFEGYTESDSYFVEIVESPERQQCAVANPSGNINGNNVTGINVYCGAPYTIGGTLSGLGSGKTVTLGLNTAVGSSLVTYTRGFNGSFEFTDSDGGPTLLPYLFPYVVTIETQPDSQTCTVTNGTGIVPARDIDNIVVTCGSSTSKKIFVTSTSSTGNLGGISGADATCASEATMFGYTGTYKALLGSASRSTSSNWVLAANTLYVQAGNTSNVIGTTNSSAIFTFPLTNSFGTISTTSWTGLTSAWAVASDTCLNWTDTVGVNGNTGINNATDSTAIAEASPEYCGTVPQTLICIEQ